MKLLRLLPLLLLLIATLPYQLVNQRLVKSYHSTAILGWDAYCQSSHPKLSNRLENVFSSNDSQCFSNWINKNSTNLEIQWAGFVGSSEKNQISLEFLDSNNKLSSIPLKLPILKPPENWKRKIVEIPPNVTKLRLKIATGKDWLAVSKRIYFLKVSKGLNLIRENFLYNKLNLKLLYWSFAFLLAFSIPLLLSFKNPFSIASLFFLLSFVTHFRAKLFFRYDEWLLLERFSQVGLSTAFVPHNEHFIPLYILMLWLQTKAFLSNYDFYTLTTIVLHTLNGFLFFRLLELLKLGRKPALLAAFLYIISGLHSELVQSAITQGAAVMLSLTLLSFIFCLKNKLFAVALCNFLAPLFFGIGFILAPLVFLFSFISNSVNKLRLLGYLSLSSTLTVLLYSLGRKGNLHLTNPTENFFLNFIEYIYTGSFLGTTIRGLGISSAHRLASFPKHALTLAVLIWLILSAYYFFTKRKKDKRELFLIFGFIFTITAMLIPALGRAVIGAQHSLTLRYQSICLIGLFIALAPALKDILFLTSKSKIGSFIMLLLLTASIHSQLLLGYKFNLFWKDGYELRDVVSRMRLVDETEFKEVLNFKELGEIAIATEERVPPLTVKKLLPGF